MTKEQKRTQQKKTTKNGRIPTLRLDNDDEISAKTMYIKDIKCFKINDVDINRIRASGKKPYNKEHNSYNYYVFYEYDDEYILLKITLRDVAGYYNDCKDNSKHDAKYSAKRMNFKLDDDSFDKTIAIFEHIEEK